MPTTENDTSKVQATVKLCTKCEKEPRADQSESATNRHCTTCRTEAARAYKAAQMEQANGKGFGKGVQAMRELMAEQFYQLGSGSLSGYEIADLIRHVPGPVAAGERDKV